MKNIDNLWISQFCRQMAILLKSGMSIENGVEIMSNNSDDISAQIYKKIYENLNNNTLSYALESTEIFPNYMIKYIKLGEKTGNLKAVFESLADYYKKLDDINSNVISAIQYPVFMSIMMLIIIGVLVLKVMPLFAKMYTQLGTGVGTISNGLMSAYDKIALCIFALGGVIAFICIYVYISLKNKNNKSIVFKLINKFKYTRNILENIDTAFFLKNINMSYQSGFDFSEATDENMQSIQSDIFKAKAKAMHEYLSIGDSLYTSLTKCKMLSPMERELISVGEMSGNIIEIIDMISNDYFEKAYRQIKKSVALIEPILISTFAVIIGGILISTILPLITITVGMM